MELSLNLNGLKFANVSDFSRTFGVKKTALQNGGSLTTKEFNEAIALPWDKQRPILLSENTTITDIECDSKLIVNANGITVTFPSSALQGVILSIVALYDCVININSETQTLKKGIYAWLYDGTNWNIEESNLCYEPLLICDTSADVQIKEVTDINIPYLTKGQKIAILFTNGSSFAYNNTATDWGQCAGLKGITLSSATENTILESKAPKLSLNEGTAYPVKIGGEFAGENFIKAGDVHTFIFDGSYWHDLDADIIYEGHNSNGSYSKKRNGLITQVFYLKKNSSTWYFTEGAQVNFFVPFNDVPYHECMYRYEVPYSATSITLRPRNITKLTFSMQLFNIPIGDLSINSDCFVFEGK